MKPLLKAILYCRVSDKKQLLEGHSFDEQEPMLREYALTQGYMVVRVFKDAAKSGTSTHKRENFKAAKTYIELMNKDLMHKGVDVFLVQDTDRAARNEFDHHDFKRFLKKHGVKLVAKNMPIDSDSPEGQLVDSTVASVSAFLSRAIGRKVRDTADQLAPQGYTLHRAPVGYLNRQKKEDSRTIKWVDIDPKKSLLVRQVFALYSKGIYSLDDIAQVMNKRGLRTVNGNELQRSSVSEILNNRYFLGKVNRNGTEYPGKHQALISDALFKKCQRVLLEQRNHGSRKRKASNDKLFYLRDKLRCGVCGYRMTGGGSAGRDHKYNYYYCGRLQADPLHHSLKGNCNNLFGLHREIEALFGVFELSDDIVQEVEKRAAQVLVETHSDVDDERAELQRSLTRLETQRQHWESKWALQEIPDDVYNRNHPAVEAEIAAAELRIAELSVARTDRTVMFESLVNLARNLPIAYKEAKPAVKKLYLNIFWEYFSIEKGAIKQAKPSKAVTALINEGLIVLKQNSQHRKILINKVWLPRLDSNQ
jgi:DNA invertase Pin-like site-specific DNA recombinase